jgi:serine/threonine-protein kinase
MSKHYLGKYRLLAELGRGGMADALLAMVEGPAGMGFVKLVVLKRLRADISEDPEFVTMLLDEARITSRLNHPNVVQMLEVGQIKDECFLAMEFLDGQPFDRVLRRSRKSGKPLSAAAQYVVLTDVLSGLRYAHDLSDYSGTPLAIVHRDISPHNVFVTYEGHVKIMDFGIAKAAGRAQHTKAGILKGKTRFMAPEQVANKAVDRRADIFAVGIALWQAATGKRFWGDDIDDYQIVEALFASRFETSPRAVLGSVPEAIDHICRRALAPDVNDRYPSALEMQRDLETFLGADAPKARRELVAVLGTEFTKERAALRSVVEAAGKESAGSVSLAVLNASTTSGIPALRMSSPDLEAEQTTPIQPAAPKSKPEMTPKPSTTRTPSRADDSHTADLVQATSLPPQTGGAPISSRRPTARSIGVTIGIASALAGLTIFTSARLADGCKRGAPTVARNDSAMVSGTMPPASSIPLGSASARSITPTTSAPHPGGKPESTK